MKTLITALVALHNCTERPGVRSTRQLLHPYLEMRVMKSAPTLYQRPWMSSKPSEPA